jgi:hypothetical protein
MGLSVYCVQVTLAGKVVCSCNRFSSSKCVVDKMFKQTYTIGIYCHVYGSVCSHLLRLVPRSRIYYTLKMEAIRSSETSVNTISTQRHIPEDGILN